MKQWPKRKLQLMGLQALLCWIRLCSAIMRLSDHHPLDLKRVEVEMREVVAQALRAEGEIDFV